MATSSNVLRGISCLFMDYVKALKGCFWCRMQGGIKKSFTQDHYMCKFFTISTISVSNLPQSCSLRVKSKEHIFGTLFISGKWAQTLSRKRTEQLYHDQLNIYVYDKNKGHNVYNALFFVLGVETKLVAYWNHELILRIYWLHKKTTNKMWKYSTLMHSKILNLFSESYSMYSYAQIIQEWHLLDPKNAYKK